MFKILLFIVKNEINVAYNENIQVNSTGIFYDCCSNQQPPFFSGRQDSENLGGRKDGKKNLLCFTNKIFNPLEPEDNSTKCFTCQCKFHWAYNCPYAESFRNKQKDSEKENYLSVANIVSTQMGRQWSHLFE